MCGPDAGVTERVLVCMRPLTPPTQPTIDSCLPDQNGSQQAAILWRLEAAAAAAAAEASRCLVDEYRMRIDATMGNLTNNASVKRTANGLAAREYV